MEDVVKPERRTYYGYHERSDTGRAKGLRCPLCKTGFQLATDPQCHMIAWAGTDDTPYCSEICAIIGIPSKKSVEGPRRPQPTAKQRREM
jgi:hypothetical protein